MGPTIQQGVIQHPVRQRTQTTMGNVNPVPTGAQPQRQSHNNGNIMSDPEGSGRDRLLECDSNNCDYVMNCIHENRPLSINDIGRPVFVNHYYAGEPLIPVTSKKFIRLDDCDVSMEISTRNLQTQGPSCESREAS